MLPTPQDYTSKPSQVAPMAILGGRKKKVLHNQLNVEEKAPSFASHWIRSLWGKMKIDIGYIITKFKGYLAR